MLVYKLKINVCHLHFRFLPGNLLDKIRFSRYPVFDFRKLQRLRNDNTPGRQVSAAQDRQASRGMMVGVTSFVSCYP